MLSEDEYALTYDATADRDEQLDPRELFRAIQNASAQ